MNKIHLALVLHSHQPFGNFEEVIEEAYQKSYLPFLETVHGFPSLKINLHCSGILLDWLELKHPDYFELVQELVQQERLELMGGGYYEPILSILPPRDTLRQMKMLAGRLETLFQRQPRGAWLAERVWEQSLTAALHAAGAEYVILDEVHFLYAGLAPEELNGYFITEEMGETLRLIPGNKKLRYTIPFADPWVTIDYLRNLAERKPNTLVVMGDDCEKFGAWPKTYKHVYEDRWLARFFEELEKNRDWIELVQLSDYLDAFPPLRKIYIPDASYPEMMEWALPVRSREIQHRCMEKLKYDPESEPLLSFVRGGYWRNFLSKYPEADFLHKKMLAVSRRVEKMREDPSLGSTRQKQLERATRCLLQSQCNDAYWHGVFGGIYAPHLRTELLASLIEANHRLDLAEGKLEPEGGSAAEFQDFDGDGNEEMLVRSPRIDLYFQLADGATLREMDFKPSAAPLVNSLKRQPEFYHRYLSGNAGGSSDSEIRQGFESLTPAERELDRFLRYDRYARHCFRLFLFPRGKGLEDYDRQTLEENEALAAGLYQKGRGEQGGEAFWPLVQTVKVGPDGNGGSADFIKSYYWRTMPDLTTVVGCRFSWEGDAAFFESQRLGVENVINFLAPTSWDRAIFSREEEGSPGNFEERLSWRGLLEKRKRLGFVDGWRRVEVQLCFDRPVDWWIVPLYTVSRSEEGLEKIYQGTQVLAVLGAGEAFSVADPLDHWLEIRKV